MTSIMSILLPPNMKGICSWRDFRYLANTSSSLLRSRRTRALRSFHLQASPPAPRRHTPAIANRIQFRFESNATIPKPLTDRAEQEGNESAEAIAVRKAQEPAYQMTFTCKQCDTRSSHRLTKQAYHHGTILITCPGCKNRHLIADHLKIFSDKAITLEDILREKGQYLKKGRLGEDGDIEFYEDENKPTP